MLQGLSDRALLPMAPLCLTRTAKHEPCIASRRDHTHPPLTVAGHTTPYILWQITPAGKSVEATTNGRSTDARRKK